MLRIANVIEEGKLGGPQLRMVRVAAYLQGQAETLIVMPCANSEAFRALCDENSVAWRTLPLTRITKEWRVALAYCLFSPIEVLQLAALFRRENIDLVHASGGSWQYKAVLAASLSRVPVIWHLNDSSMPGWVRVLFRLVQPLADGFMFTSKRTHSYYSPLISGKRPQVIVPPPTDTKYFNPDIRILQNNLLPNSWLDKAIVGTVANVNPIKGLETLIKAMSIVKRIYHNTAIVIIGSVFTNQEAYFCSLKSLINQVGLTESDIFFTGGLSDVRSILSRLDVYVCSSHAEGWGMSLWEAMAMARPVVSTNVGDMAHHVVDGTVGFIVPVGDAETMADRIGILLGKPKLRERMGKAARNAVTDSFTPEVIAKKTMEFYRNVTGNCCDMHTT